MKFILCTLGAIALIGSFAPKTSQAASRTYKESVKIWQSYYPDMNCRKNECAKKVPPKALEALLEKGSYMFPGKLTKANWMMVSDFTQNSKNKRGYLISTKTGNTTQFHVTHGKGTGDNEGNAVRFSNISESHMSSKGLYVTAETYYGGHGYSLRMDGHESTNSKARKRLIVIHGATYAAPGFVKAYGRAGRSHGCPAVDTTLAKDLINKLKGGSLYYIHGE